MNQQQITFQQLTQKTQPINNDSQGYEIFQLNQYQQPQQLKIDKNYKQENHNQYQQNEWIETQNIQENLSKISIQQQYSQVSQKKKSIESLYVEEKTSRLQQSAKNSSDNDNNQFSQTQRQTNLNEQISNNQASQKYYANCKNQQYDTQYYNELKNFYQLRQVSQQKQKLVQMDQVGVSYKNCPIQPIIFEFENFSDINQVFGGNIFEIPFGQPFQSIELFLNNHFFILREDYLKDFRRVVSILKQSGLENIPNQILQSAFIYFNVLVENIIVTNLGFQFIVTMNMYQRNKHSTNWQKSTRLMSGSLLLLSTKKLEFMLFGTVVEKPKSDQDGRVTITISLIGLSMKEQLKYVNSLLSQENQLIAIENKVYFETYTHFLNCIQKIEPSQLPFAEQIVFGSKIMPIPGYLNKQEIIRRGIYYNIDLKFDLHQPELFGQSQPELFGQSQTVNIFRDWSQVNQKNLDESQLKAIQSILKNGISLIQGPPGTGKTFCGALGVKILLENQINWNDRQDDEYQDWGINQYKQNKPILIVCQTNHALDQFLRHILTFCQKEEIVRIGGRCKVKDFEPMLLNFNQQSRKIHFKWEKFIKLKDYLNQKLRNLLNLVDNVCYKDVQQYMPDLFEKVIFQYLEIEDLNFQYPVSVDTKKIIMHMWLDSFKPRQEQAQKIIEIEKNCKNILKKEQLNKQQFKSIMVYKYSDIENQFQLSEEATLKLKKDEEEDNMDENQNLDSDEEENRKALITLQHCENEELIKQLIHDAKTVKRLLNRLSKDNEANFQKLMLEFNENSNYRIWEMPQTQRNVITRYIFSQKFKFIFQLLEENLDEFELYTNELKQAYIDADLKYIQSKKIVGMTLAGCSKYAEKLQNLNFNILIIEEACEVLESNLIAVLSKQINHLIMIGDHQQLKPHMECYELQLKFKAIIYHYLKEYVTLKYQRRMKSKFADFIRLIYSDYQDHISIQEQNHIHIEGFKSDLLLFDHRYQEDQRINSSSKLNKFEAKMIIKMVDYMLKNGIQKKQITILTSYVKQALYIQKELNCREIKIQAIDNYQGEENDIILLSLVRSNDNYKLGFVAIDNRICVAFSRARLGLYVFGDFDFIQKCIKNELIKNPQKRNSDISDLWLRIIDLANQKGVIKNCIEIECFSHNQVTKIFEIKDWDSVKNGGCLNICGIQFPCGHICKKRCHKSNHQQQDCLEQCNKQLSCGHYCLGFCNQIKCPPCKTLIEKKIPSCGHITKIFCSEKDPQCKEKCNKILNCGHQCSLKCIDDCKNNKCLEPSKYTLQKCQHEISIRCDDINYVDKLICSIKCQYQQICGHICNGTCSTCFDKFHLPCIQKCDKTLCCGHQCQLLCSQECYKCEEQCQIKCNCNIGCIKKCYQVCHQCTKICNLKCQHSQCTNKCYEICDRQPCNQKCTKTLQCGCQCMGFCGENCPQICQDKLHNNQFADKDTFYYQLECDCKLIIEAQFLDGYFDNQNEKLIQCPNQNCKKIITKSSRYQQQVKNSLKWFNEQKEDKIQKYFVTNDKIFNAIQLVKQKLLFVQSKKLKDKDSFLDKILQELQQEQKLTSYGRDSKMTYHYFKCIKRQMKFYEKSVELMQCLNNSIVFQFHKHNLIAEYLMNEDFRQNYSNSFWWKVKTKLENLLIFQKSFTLFQNTQQPQFQNIYQEIEASNFFLDDQKKLIFENILENPPQQ